MPTSCSFSINERDEQSSRRNRAIICANTPLDQELSKSFYVGRHRPVSDRLDLFWIGPDAVLTHDATKKWYFASSKYALLQVGIQLMLTHQCKNLSDVESVDFQIRLSIHNPAMDEHVIKNSWVRALALISTDS